MTNLRSGTITVRQSDAHNAQAFVSRDFFRTESTVNGGSFTLYVDGDGLVITESTGCGMVIKPRGSNSIRLEVQP